MHYHVDYAMKAVEKGIEGESVSELFRLASSVIDAVDPWEDIHGPKGPYKNKEMESALVHILEAADFSDEYKKRIQTLRKTIVDRLVINSDMQGSIAQTMYYWHDLPDRKRLAGAQKIIDVMDKSFCESFAYTTLFHKVRLFREYPYLIGDSETGQLLEAYQPVKIIVGNQESMKDLFDINAAKPEDFNDVRTVVANMFTALHASACQRALEHRIIALRTADLGKDDMDLLSNTVGRNFSIPYYLPNAKESYCMERFSREQHDAIHREIHDAVEAKLDNIPPIQSSWSLHGFRWY